MKALIVIALLAIVASLGQALFAMASGPDNSGRMVRALTVRIVLSLLLFAAIMIGAHFGVIEPIGQH